MEIIIAHVYPELLNLYGDSGNLAVLKMRLKKRGIDVKINEYSINDNIDFNNTDILYIGGGTDREQLIACQKLCEKKQEIKSYADNGGTVLAFAAGFPLLGEYFEQNNKKIEGLSLIDMYTKHSEKRNIGNIILKSDLLNTTIVGFENHSSKTILNNNTSPLGKVLYGYGNDGNKDFEGAISKNVIGTYLHGPLLPKNPVLADYILKNALIKKYGNSELEPLDDSMENMAHEYILKRYIK